MGRCTVQLGLYKIFVHFKAFVHESIILLLPPHTCNAHTSAVLVHDYCAIYDSLPNPLSYSIHHTILVMAISCKGQGAPQCATARWRGASNSR